MSLSTPTWLRGRSSGVLAHISSLPGPYGIGNLGAGARAFLDFLSKAGVRHWQICPVGVTSFRDSPYQSFSSFAGNPYFIDLGELVENGLLTVDEVAPLKSLPEDRVDYGQLYALFWNVMARAQERFVGRGKPDLPGFGDYQEFCEAQVAWLRPFADFMALKARFGERPWMYWPEEIRGWHEDLRDVLPAATRGVAERHEFYQYLFFGQWHRLRSYAHERQIDIIGDLPIFVALDSADTWHSRSVFRLDENGQPLASAGVPPDYFSESGQFWGNPLYDWNQQARTGFTWWIARLRAAFELFDIVRLDHFRGFDTFWEIPAGSQNARTGEWRKGPGEAFFSAVRYALPHARIIAEDLGYITEGVVKLRQSAGLPGMKVLQFAYGHDDNNVNLPHFFPRESVVYTGTHDNTTTRGWLEALPAETAALVDEYFQLKGSRSAWPLIRAAFSCASKLAVIPMQDLLDLPESARMNRPGVPDDNWQWRFTDGQLRELGREKSETLRRWNELFDRTGDDRQREYSAPPSAAHAEPEPARVVSREARAKGRGGRRRRPAVSSRATSGS